MLEESPSINCMFGGLCLVIFMLFGSECDHSTKNSEYIFRTFLENVDYICLMAFTVSRKISGRVLTRNSANLTELKKREALEVDSLLIA